MKSALVTGITGQDGSYMIELLLSKGYDVHGLIRRSSTLNTGRIHPSILNNPNLHLHYGDLSDSDQITKIITNNKLDEIYNLAAQSHVRVSFDTPEYTGNVTGLGVTRILEAIRISNHPSKFYQASSSEMFGSAPAPQSERTEFHPRSPYGCAKLYAYWMTKNYREGYDMFSSNGVLFNHETIVSFMPMFYKTNNDDLFDIKPICEIVSFDETKQEYQDREINNIQVWGKGGWVDVTFASAYPHDIVNDNKNPKFINARCGAFMATSSHVAFMENGEEKSVNDISIGDKFETITLPTSIERTIITEEEAELMGMLVADGSISYRKKGTGLRGKFTKISVPIKERFTYLWNKITGGSVKYRISHSGFKPENIVGQLSLNGGNDWLRSLDLYTKDKKKRVPKCILNSSSEIMLAFLKGYNTCDGLKQNPCTYEFKNFKTNSATLAMGLWYLIDQTTKQTMNLTIETKPDGRMFYSINLLSTTNNFEKENLVNSLIGSHSQREISRMTDISRKFIRKIQNGGHADVHPLKKSSNEIKKIINLPNYNGWFYDLETSSGEFHCGIGKCHVHNSPRRGETFVTRKITLALANILAHKQDKLVLGNLNAHRDWGFAPEYVEAMWSILQANRADDFVIGTGEAHSVKEFLFETFKYAGLDASKYVQYDENNTRATEVDILIADIARAKKTFKWNPKITFKDLIKIMVDSDMRLVGLEPMGEGDEILHKKFPNRWWVND